MDLLQFSADYRDGWVYLGGKVYPAGTFAVHFLNQYYENDTAARIAIFADDIQYNVLWQLQNDYLNIEEFVKTGENTLYSLTFLPELHPFDMLDIPAIKERVTELFTEEIGDCICFYLSEKARISLLDQNEVCVGTPAVSWNGWTVTPPI